MTLEDTRSSLANARHSPSYGRASRLDRPVDRPRQRRDPLPVAGCRLSVAGCQPGGRRGCGRETPGCQQAKHRAAAVTSPSTPSGKPPGSAACARGRCGGCRSPCCLRAAWLPAGPARSGASNQPGVFVNLRTAGPFRGLGRSVADSRCQNQTLVGGGGVCSSTHTARHRLSIVATES